MGNLVYTAGQTPLDPVRMEVAAGSTKAQTTQVLANRRAVLQAAGSDTTVYYRNLGD